MLDVKTKYGFLFQGYTGRAYYWEIIVMFRKIGIIMTTVFFSTLSPELQVLVVLIIAVVCQLFHFKVEPYSTPTLNQMETNSLVVCILTLYFGMYYVTGAHYTYMDNAGVSWMFLILIIVPNLYFFGFWVLKMRIEVLKMVYKMNKPSLLKLVSCMDQDVFYDKYIKPDEEILIV